MDKQTKEEQRRYLAIIILPTSQIWDPRTTTGCDNVFVWFILHSCSVLLLKTGRLDKYFPSNLGIVVDYLDLFVGYILLW